MMAREADGDGIVRRALAGHASIGLLAASLLYVIALTGTLAVIHDRWERWEQPTAPEMRLLSAAATQHAVVDAAEGLPVGKATSQITLQLPSADLPRAIVGTDQGSWYVDSAGHRAERVEAVWTEFIVSLHERLLLPESWGYALVGALGVALAALASTGVLAHPRIVRDAFRLRWRQGSHIARVDWHNRLAVWSLPFAIAIGLTGAVLGLGTLGFTVLANVYHHGRVEAAYAPLFGAAPRADATAAPLPNVAAAFAALHAIAPDARPANVTVLAPGTVGQEVRVLAIPPGRLIYGETYRFDRLGRPLGRIGLSDGALGQQAIASVYGLHFGSYGGLPVEFAYLLFGLATCAVTATGPSIWLHRRTRRGVGSASLTAVWNMVVWGTPLLLALCWWVRVLTLDGFGLMPFFVTGGAALVVVAATRPAWVPPHLLRNAALFVIFATGLAHLVATRSKAGGVDAIDVTVVCLALLTFAILHLTGSFKRPPSRSLPNRP